MTRCWRKPDSNHQSLLQRSGIPPELSRRCRNSMHRGCQVPRARKSAWLGSAVSLWAKPLPGRRVCTRRLFCLTGLTGSPSREGPTVRIRLPPAASLLRTAPGIAAERTGRRLPPPQGWPTPPGIRNRSARTPRSSGSRGRTRARLLRECAMWWLTKESKAGFQTDYNDPAASCAGAKHIRNR